MSDAYLPGLEHVIASETSISFLDVEKEEIVIRGYDLMELAEKMTYLDVVGLLLEGKLPDERRRKEIQSQIQAEYGLPSNVRAMLHLMPDRADMMDVLRTSISAIASFDEELDDRSADANRRKAIRLLAKVPQIVAYGYRALTKQPMIEPDPKLSYTANFLYMITGDKPSKVEEAIFDQSLVVYSEHELPNSTFTARVIASTQSDLYGALVGAVASLKGTLHGGANEAVMHMLLEASSEDELEALIRSKLARKERIMGFGHRVYMRKPDPRALLMKDALAQLAPLCNQQGLYDMCVRGEEVMRTQKQLHPNLDYYAAPVYYLLGIPIELFTPIFLASRTVGISAHVMEQHGNNRLFRPRVRYTGARDLHPPQEQSLAESEDEIV